MLPAVWSNTNKAKFNGGTVPYKAIFCGDIPLHRPYIGLIYGRYLQFTFLKWPLKNGGLTWFNWSIKSCHATQWVHGMFHGKSEGLSSCPSTVEFLTHWKWPSGTFTVICFMMFYDFYGFVWMNPIWALFVEDIQHCLVVVCSIPVIFWWDMLDMNEEFSVYRRLTR